MKPFTPKMVYGRVVLSLILPLALSWLVWSDYWAIVSGLLVNHPSTTYALIISSILLGIVEWRCLDALARWILANGHIDRLNARLIDPIRVTQRHRRRLKAITAVSAMMVGFTLSEAAFRLFDIQPASPPLPYVTAATVDNRVNQLGLREDWDEVPGGDETLRIAFLGDSMTYGESVKREEAFPHVVESLLTLNLAQEVVTINLGFPNTGPQQQLSKYLEVHQQIRPDIVVHVLYLNDLGVHLHHLLQRIYRIMDDDYWTGSWSHVLRYAETQVRFRLGWRYTRQYFRGGAFKHERQKSWTKFTSDVRACKTAVESDGALYCLVLFPWLAQLDHYPLKELHLAIGEFASELDVPYIDLLMWFEGQDAMTLRIDANNEHPNKKGHHLAAQRLATFLTNDVISQWRQQRR